MQSLDNAVGSVGIVTPVIYTFDTPLALECGRVLPNYQLMVETYGTLNADASNAVLICHALSGSHHAAGIYAEQDPKTAKSGWWDACIGPNKTIDTNKFFVVSLNNLGGCNGSTGPTSKHPEHDGVYGADFPLVTVKDWVVSQALLADRLGISCWHAVIGGSLGGMQAMRWAIDYPHRLRKCVIIASAPKLTAQNIAFNEVARQSILSDPNFHNGDYIAKGVSPTHGLSVARMVGHITYLSENAMNVKFARELKTEQLNYGYDVDFQIESYLRYQGAQFSKSFDANTYMIMTKALDYFDPASEYNDNLSEAFAHTQCKFLVVSFTTDWRFAPSRSVEIVNAMMATNKPVSYINVESSQGHDAFLFAIPRYVQAVQRFLATPVESAHA